MALSPDRWDAVERLYHAARARPFDERSTFVADACTGDEELRHEVESLLAQDASANAMLTRGALNAAAGLVSDAGRSVLRGRLGAYQILAPIGAGGMGEVYRARDTRLGREVAIKILPRAFTADADRLARFEREARVLASLNHPNIAAIHGIEDTPVDGDAAVHALILELVDGETLRERIARVGSKGVPFKETLDIARQIADALDAAHEKGIVHRDLKPENIKLTRSGAVKVLDFGLAKLEAGGEGKAGGEFTEAPTITINDTREGLVVGTAAYMSPEQARGQAVGKRTDIWAFGCVVYELLTGRPTFGRETSSETIAAILDREPDWTLLPAGTPAAVRRLLARALVKDPKSRLRDVGDAKLEIEAALSEQNGAPSVVVTAQRDRVIRLSRIAPAVALLGLGVLGGTLWSSLGVSRPATFGTEPLTQITSDSGLTTEPSVSVDGSLIAYASDRSGDGNLDIWVQQAAGGSAIRLTSDPADDREPDVSPDGGLIAFRSERKPRGVYVIPALGGDARLIAPDGMGPRFSPDGRSIAFWTGGWLAPRGVGNVRRTFVVPAVGGEVVQVIASLPSAGDPVWSPDGTALMVFARRATSGEGTDPDWWWAPLKGSFPVQSGVYERLRRQGLTVGDPNTQPYPLAWTHTGVLFSAPNAPTGDLGTIGNAASQSIWTIAVDERTGRVGGDAIRLTHGTTTDTRAAMSRDGRLVFAATSEHLLLFRLPLDANAGRTTGPLQRIRDDMATIGRGGVSEDGRFLVFPRYDFGGGGVWIRELATGRERQLVATPRTPLNPVISADGRWVGYTVTKVNTGGTAGIGTGYVIGVASGTPRRVCDDCQVWQWMKDNRHILITETNDTVLNRFDLATGTRVPIIVASSNIDRPFIAPNEQWMVFNALYRGSDENGGPKVFVAPLYQDRPTPVPEWIVVHSRVGAERSAGLSPDGRLVYLLLERDGFRCLYAQRVNFATGRPQGEPFLVHHFHEAARDWGSTGFGSATVTGMFLAQLFERSGNIWMTTIESK